MCADEIHHYPNACSVLTHLERHTSTHQQRLFPAKRLVLANDDALNAVQQNRAAAHGAGRERGVERRVAIDGRGLAAGVFERIHLAMQHRAAVLHSAVVTATDDLALSNDDRADRNAALAQALLGFGDGGGQERVGTQAPDPALAIIASYSNTLGPSGASRARLTMARATVSARIGR